MHKCIGGEGCYFDKHCRHNWVLSIELFDSNNSDYFAQGKRPIKKCKSSRQKKTHYDCVPCCKRRAKTRWKAPVPALKIFTEPTPIV